MKKRGRPAGSPNKNKTAPKVRSSVIEAAALMRVSDLKAVWCCLTGSSYLPKGCETPVVEKIEEKSGFYYMKCLYGVVKIPIQMKPYRPTVGVYLSQHKEEINRQREEHQKKCGEVKEESESLEISAAVLRNIDTIKILESASTIQLSGLKRMELLEVLEFCCTHSISDAIQNYPNIVSHRLVQYIENKGGSQLFKTVEEVGGVKKCRDAIKNLKLVREKLG